MLGALIIVFREVIEAGLIVGIVLAVTRGVPGRGQWVTAGVLMGHNLWMASHGQEMAASMAAVGKSVTAGQRPMAALALVVGIATLREGSEVVLFLYGIVAAGASASSLLLGGSLGLLAGAAFTALTYYGLLAIPARHIFA